ncbi:hypothetical protein [Dysgonomonas sp. 521]|uniref:hypothetical protein n=1 Tax=Dysgonomonas sp. 521 TaxID=2302932 RepID=UPI0013D2FEAA|nr:hypothetical protein [Dysgonomonas sp. 521]
MENDRYRLVLLEHIKDRTKHNDKEFNRLLLNYPDYVIGRFDIERDLLKRGFLKSVDLRPDLPNQDDDGNYIDYNKRGIKKYETITTESGIASLKSNIFSSEILAKKREEMLRLLDIAVKWFAVIGGALGLYSFLRTFFCL